MGYRIDRDPKDSGVVQLFWSSEDFKPETEDEWQVGEENHLLELREDELTQLALVLMNAVLPPEDVEL